jgi:hypothetical protein
MRRHSIESLRAFAKSHGGECLSEEYIGNGTSYKWKCIKGHVFNKVLVTLLRKHAVFCLECQKPDYIEIMRQYAKDNNGELLDDTYIETGTSYSFKCSEGHTFLKTYKAITVHTWFCSICNKNNTPKEPDILQRMKNLAMSRKGECLSTAYINIKTYYDWRCEFGHEWSARWCDINSCRRSWCPHCLKKWNFGTIKAWVEANREGTCVRHVSGAKHQRGIYLFTCSNGHFWETRADCIISTGSWCGECRIWSLDKIREYVEANMDGRCVELVSGFGIKGMYLFECNNGHAWITTADGVINGRHWCKECRFWTLEDIQTYVRNNTDGECVKLISGSNTYGIYEFKCSKGHIWECCASNVIHNGTWCWKCHIWSIEEIRYFVEKNMDGKCLELVSGNGAIGRYLFECSKGHVWECCANSVVNARSWCPNCLYKSESACRDIFEELFKVKFPKIRLKCMDLQLAFEYNSKLHYEYVPYFHRNGEDDFVKTQERDRRKLELAKQNGIDLIIIPHMYNYMHPIELKLFIIDEINKLDNYIVV